MNHSSTLFLRPVIITDGAHSGHYGIISGIHEYYFNVFISGSTQFITTVVKEDVTVISCQAYEKIVKSGVKKLPVEECRVLAILEC